MSKELYDYAREYARKNDTFEMTDAEEAICEEAVSAERYLQVVRQEEIKKFADFMAESRKKVAETEKHSEKKFKQMEAVLQIAGLPMPLPKTPSNTFYQICDDCAIEFTSESEMEKHACIVECSGCLNNEPNQLGHMRKGGCLSWSN
jgi:hypothetical protein